MHPAIRLHTGSGIGQVGAMYFLFLWEVVKRALTPVPRVTDMLQILAASALPATSKFVGVELPQNAGESALAYIGLVALSFVIIRLFWAPYSIWRDQNGEIGSLKLELNKPEKIELARMAELRADAKSEMSGAINQMLFLTMEVNPLRNSEKIGALIRRISSLSGPAHTSQSFANGYSRLGLLCYAIIREGKTEGYEKRDAVVVELANAMELYLHGRITAEDLALRLPPKPE